MPPRPRRAPTRKWPSVRPTSASLAVLGGLESSDGSVSALGSATASSGTRLSSHFFLGQRDDSKLDRRDAHAQHPELTRGAAREVDDEAVRDRSAIVDLHADVAAVVGAAHFEPGAERERAVRGGELRGIEDFAARGVIAREGRAVPARVTV